MSIDKNNSNKNFPTRIGALTAWIELESCLKRKSISYLNL